MEASTYDLRAAVIYQYMISVIVPRPIAWVSTISATGLSNLAPFSFFSGVGSRPPSLLFCPANRRDGTPKDTLRNIRDVGEFIVNIVPESLAEVMNQTSAELPDDESEFEAFTVASCPGHRVAVPRVALSPVHLECVLLDTLAIGHGPGGANVVIGSIVHIHIDDDVLNEVGNVNAEALNAVGRLGGNSYCRTGDRFALPRPG